MAALGRKVFDWHRLVPLTWARIARQTPRGGQKRTSASLLCKLTTASNGGGLEKLSRVESRKYMQEPECRTSLTRCPQGKQRTPVAPGFLEQEKVISSLLDMGFSDVHINELLRLWPSTHPQQLLDIISELILLGLNPEPVYVALKKSPQLLKLPVMHVRKRSSYLRKLGLGEGKLKTVLLCCPQILTMHQRDIDSIVGVLKEKCLFTVRQVTRILHRCPYVLQEDPGELEYKFQRPWKNPVRQQLPPGVILTPGNIQQRMRTFLVLRTEGGRRGDPAAGGWAAVSHPAVHRMASSRTTQPELSPVRRLRNCPKASVHENVRLEAGLHCLYFFYLKESK
ncbi:transcription termination factor 4, mitochondrial isoform X2 [Phoca vitulina]|uniref:transcription termination factor 4, mitochondrial isoform X2 n=1 Tax=Phoca vitulina TaxID=9720 RepID=UPI001395F6ED|nr:transcription termination factor 4, mitochondrial isoform X2 [Phoca vitulina]